MTRTRPDRRGDQAVSASTRGTSTFLASTIDLNPHLVPKKPGAYLRISDDPNKLLRGTDRQKADVQQKCRQLSWGKIAKVYTENDTSAFKKKRVQFKDGSVGYRNVRPEFQQMMLDLASGVIDGIVVYDQDRLLRQPRDLEDLIDLVENLRVPVAGVTGMIDLLTSSGRMVARMMAAMAIKSSEDTSRRVARAAVADAKAGTVVRGGPRRYGWESDGITLVPAEAKLLLEIRDLVLAGDSASTIALELQRRGVPTVTGAKWTGTTVNTLMRSPRLGGIRSYQGVFQGPKKPTVNQWWVRAVHVDGEYVMGPWTPLMSVEEWEALQHALDSQMNGGGPRGGGNGGHGRGNPKHLLTGLAVCGNCGGKMVGRVMRGRPCYGCRPKDLGGCNAVSRNLPKVDALILELAIRQLNRDKVSSSRTRRPASGDRAKEIAELTRRKAKATAAWMAGQFPDEDYYPANAEFNARLVALREELASIVTVKLPPRKVMAEQLADPATPTHRKRTLLGELIEAVVINKSSRGPHFSAEDIDIQWRAEMAE